MTYKNISGKICKICNQNKLLSEYYKDKRGKFGVYSACKKCHETKYVSVWRKNKGKEWRKIHDKARSAVHKALKNNLLVKTFCSSCSSLNVQAHHYLGYEKENWLKVVWLCQKHHTQVHNN